MVWVTPEREKLIRAAWARVRDMAIPVMCGVSPCFRAELQPPMRMEDLIYEPVVETSLTEAVVFVHEVEHLPGTSWRVICEGVIVEIGELEDELSRLLRKSRSR